MTPVHAIEIANGERAWPARLSIGKSAENFHVLGRKGLEGARIAKTLDYSGFQGFPRRRPRPNPA